MTQAASQHQTIPDLFAATVAARGDQEALGIIKAGALSWITWRQLAEKVERWAAVLAHHKIGRGDRVAQLSPNCEDWILADLAIQSLGAVHVPLHVALSRDQMAQQIVHSGAKLLISYLPASEAFRDQRSQLEHVTQLLHSDLSLIYGETDPTSVSSYKTSPDDLATILYTSGTTGEPRGVMLTQRNIATNAVALADALATDSIETRLLILPLSHIYARTCDLYCWIYRGSKLVIAESRETALRDCQIGQPTVINAVPYFYQKVADSLRASTSQVDNAALKAALGGQIKRLHCGGAALPWEVETFFNDRGLPVLSGYGLTEASPVITAATPQDYSPGSVGRPLPNVEVRLGDDGEIQARGPNIMQGYWHNEAETHRVIDEGWLHTGDLGKWDPNGHLRIIGRKKEMVVLSTGKKVAPTQIEQLLLGSPWIEQCCVLGDGRKCLAALIVPNPAMLRDFIKRNRLIVWSRKRALSHPKVRAHFRREIDRCLAAAAEFEQAGAFTLIGRAFSIEAGEMTPKLSLCRNKIATTFATEIEAMYAKSPSLAGRG